MPSSSRSSVSPTPQPHTAVESLSSPLSSTHLVSRPSSVVHNSSSPLSTALDHPNEVLYPLLSTSPHSSDISQTFVPISSLPSVPTHHSMTTKSKNGIVKPKRIFGMTVVGNESCLLVKEPAHFSEANKHSVWQQAMNTLGLD